MVEICLFGSTSIARLPPASINEAFGGQRSSGRRASVL